VLCFVSAWATYYKAEEPIADSYLVVFHKTVSENSIAAHKNLVSKHQTTITSHFSIGDFRGYAATVSKEFVATIEQQPEVAWVEEDGIVRVNHETVHVNHDATCRNQTGASWGLVRTSQKKLDPTAPYEWLDSNDGSGVTVFVFDTGIFLGHQEFGGRAVWGTNTVDKTTTDGNGHGTHCAGVVGGKTYGMAKQAKLVAVKVLGDSGAGTIQAVVDGINWAVANFVRPSVGSMSVGGGKSPTMNDAVTAAAKSGLVIAVPAGNSNTDACNFSPGSTPEAITVAASDRTDSRSTSVNWGSCVSLYGPGMVITSAWIGRPDAVQTLSGSSVAVPHVAGEVAKYLQTNAGSSAAASKAWILKNAQKDVVTNGGISGTPNLLLFADCGSF